MNMKVLLVMATILFSVANVSAKNLPLDEAITLGVAGDDLRVAEQQIMKAQAMLDEAKTGHYPALTVSANYQFASNVFAATSIMTPQNMAKGGVEASYLLFAFGRIQDSINAMMSSKNAIELQKDIVRSELVYSVRVAYYAALVSDELLNVVKSSYDNAVKSKNLISKQATVRAAQSDLIKLSADIASRKTDLETAKVNRVYAYRLLKTLTDLTEEDITLTTTFDLKKIPIVKNTEIIGKAKAAGDDQIKQLKLFDIQMQSNSYIRDSKSKGWLPTLSIAAGYNASYSTYKTTGSALPFVFPKNTDQGYVGVALNFPIFDIFKSRSQAQQYEIDNYILTSKKNIQRRDIVRELSDAIESYNSYQDILKLNDEAIVLAQRSYDLSLARFLNGQTSATELNDVERSLSILKQSKAQSINKIYSSLAVIEKYVGEVK